MNIEEAVGNGCEYVQVQRTLTSNQFSNKAAPDQDGVAAAVRVNKTHDGNGGVKMRPKSEMGFRTVELTPRTVDMLKDYLENEDIVAGERIFKQYSLQYSSRKIGNIVKDAFTQADVHINPNTGRSFVSPHWMRHQRNSRLRKQYGKETAMQYMGHEDEDTSDDYMHRDSEEIQGVL